MGNRMPLVKSWGEFFRTYGQRIFKDGKPYNLMVSDEIKKLSEKYHIHIATNQIGYENRIYTLEWLEQYEIPYDAITFSRDKHNIGGELIVDDCTDVLLTTEAHGIKSICFDRLWNKDWRGTRIRSLTELL
jgi:5'(3')-deoxyribonucleotidase